MLTASVDFSGSSSDRRLGSRGWWIAAVIVRGVDEVVEVVGRAGLVGRGVMYVTLPEGRWRVCRVVLVGVVAEFGVVVLAVAAMVGVERGGKAER